MSWLTLPLAGQGDPQLTVRPSDVKSIESGIDPRKCAVRLAGRKGAVLVQAPRERVLALIEAAEAAK